MKAVWRAERVVHDEQQRIAIYFEKDAQLIARVKKLPGVKWSQTLKAWHITDNQKNRLKFKLPETIVNMLPVDKTDALFAFGQWLLARRYSDSTVKTYLEALRCFFTFYSDKESSKIDNTDVIYFHTHYILAKKLSISYQNQIHPVG